MPRHPARQEHRRAILDGLARYLWVYAWSNWDEFKAAPPTPSAANKAAQDLARLIESANRQPLEVMRRDLAAEIFGWNIAAEAVGSGSLIGLGILVPRFSIAYDGEVLSWDGTDVGDDPPKSNPAMSRILLIEDEPARQDDMVRLFKRMYPSATVDIVDNAIDAIHKIDTQPYELYVSDYDLEDGTTGGDVLEHIQDAHPALAKRFLFTSGNPIVQDIHPYWIMKGEITRAKLTAVIERMPIANPSACCAGCA